MKKEPNEDCYGAQILGGIPLYSNLCGVRPYFDDLVSLLGREPKVWRQSRLRLHLPGGRPICLPIVDFIPGRPCPQSDLQPAFEASTLVQFAIDLCHEHGDFVFFHFDTDDCHPDVFVNPDGFWVSWREMRLRPGQKG
jgi:hypothetical protein